MNNFDKITAMTAVSGFSLLILSACGGGGSSNGPFIPPPGGGGGGSSPPTWTQGVFQDEALFKNRCEAPRSGSSPHTGNAYPDVAGSTLEENHWLRSWSNRTYLWYSEITDQDPAGFDDPLDYFDELKTFRDTASGAPVDKFHFTVPTDEYEERVNSGSSSGYGARFRLIQSSPPRDVRVAYVEAGSPAASANLLRGTEILEIDGVDVINGTDVDTLNAGLFPATDGETHTFVVRDVGATNTRTVSITSASVTSNPVLTESIINLPSGDRVGYVLFNTFGTSIAEEQLFNTFTNLQTQNLDELVLDLRYNGGGFLDISSELAFMIAGPTATQNKIYETLVFNDKYPNTNPVNGNALTPTPFHSTGQGFSVASGTPLPSLSLPRVFVLSTAGTCSASESLVNSLLGIDVEVVLIGSTTCGKPYGFYATDNCGTTYFTIQFRGENDKGFGDYSDGFSPDNGGTITGESVTGCEVPDDFSKQLGDETEAMLSTAISYIENGSCPAAPVTQAKASWGVALDNETEGSLLNDTRVRNQLLLDNSRILTKPRAR